MINLFLNSFRECVIYSVHLILYLFWKMLPLNANFIVIFNKSSVLVSDYKYFVSLPLTVQRTFTRIYHGKASEQANKQNRSKLLN